MVSISSKDVIVVALLAVESGMACFVWVFASCGCVVLTSEGAALYASRAGMAMERKTGRSELSLLLPLSLYRSMMQKRDTRVSETKGKRLCFVILCRQTQQKSWVVWFRSTPTHISLLARIVVGNLTRAILVAFLARLGKKSWSRFEFPYASVYQTKIRVRLPVAVAVPVLTKEGHDTFLTLLSHEELEKVNSRFYFDPASSSSSQ